MSLMPVDLVRGDIVLPSLSEIYQKFTRKLDDPAAKATDFAEIIESDPALTAKVLKIVNSAYFSFSAEVTRIPHAVTILGLADLRDMVLAISVVDFFNGLPNDLISMKQFWEHSIRTGLVARSLQKASVVRSSESLFTAGLLHDLGSLVIYNRIPELARSVLEMNSRQETARFLLEQEIIGFDHAAVGMALIQHWGLPEVLATTTGYHHAPEKAELFQQETSVIALSDQIVRMNEAGDAEFQALLSEEVFSGLGINSSDVELALSDCAEQLSSVMGSITQ